MIVADISSDIQEGFANSAVAVRPRQASLPNQWLRLRSVSGAEAKLEMTETDDSRLVTINENN
ncbi:hypothetical protein FKX85_05540 [Echinicola soli]|uniref:Uncharacterized protein n=1 Tax=Echinicola soli TaxID=2591634 RepID=A0A514CFI0_9BACT|nr:hypothetical protein [Echinicola soli]QDH78520.1 hypothetical protein FKX85_05540 [Echinicola soli]